MIQTAEPGHPVLQQVIAGDYEAMARQQLAERKAFFYPPYARLLNLLLRHRDPVTRAVRPTPWPPPCANGSGGACWDPRPPPSIGYGASIWRPCC